MKNLGGRPRVLHSGQQVSVQLTTEMVGAMAQLAALTGEGRSSIVRRGVAMALVEAGLWARGSEHEVVPVPTTTLNPKEHDV